jgi:hypothetical protein
MAKKRKGALAAAGLWPGRGALLTGLLLLAIGVGAIVWSQTPWTGNVAVKESEWKIVLSAPRHEAGDITFDLSNRGTIPHEFVVIKTDKTAAELVAEVDPATNRLDESTLTSMGEHGEYDPATNTNVTLTLAPGHYVVMCNIEGHYKNGMHADLDVTARSDGKVVVPTPIPTDPPATGAVDGQEKEWQITLGAETHVAGSITFNLTNKGTINHEFVVIKTDKTGDQLVSEIDPATNRLNEDTLVSMGEQGEYAPGSPGGVTLDLLPGHYVVMCNIAGHYKNGMHADFEVVAN